MIVYPITRTIFLCFLICIVTLVCPVTLHFLSQHLLFYFPHSPWFVSHSPKRMKSLYFFFPRRTFPSICPKWLYILSHILTLYSLDDTVNAYTVTQMKWLAYFCLPLCIHTSSSEIPFYKPPFDSSLSTLLWLVIHSPKRIE